MYTQPLPLGEKPRMSFDNLPQSTGTINLVDSTEKLIRQDEDVDPIQYEDVDPIISESNHTQIGMFGDFCLLCGEMIDRQGFDGSSAYCSQECEYHQHLMSDSDWCDLSVEGYQLPSYGGSTTVSSAKTTPLNSPHLQPSDRLAILCSGPPPCELLLPLDLNERLLGAKAVAERYLERGRTCAQDEADSEDDKKDLTLRLIPQPLDDPGDRNGSQDPLVQANSKLKSQPASAQLSDFNHLTCLSELLAKKEDFTIRPSLHSQSISLVDLASPALTAIDPPHLPGLSSKTSRRVSEPVFGQTKSISLSPTTHQLPYSSFSFSPPAAQSHISLNRSNNFFQNKR